MDYIYKVLTRPDEKPTAGSRLSIKTQVPREQRQPSYQFLPHARPGGIAGLLEILLDHDGGRDDIFRLADELALEADDLLPIVDAAALLGFLKIEEGDVAITDIGPEICRVGYFGPEGALSRSNRLKTCCCCDRFSARSQTSRDHSVSEDFFHDLLDEQFSEDETLRQLETAINWGRYSELFDLTQHAGDFVLPQETEEAAEVTAGES